MINPRLFFSKEVIKVRISMNTSYMNNFLNTKSNLRNNNINGAKLDNKQENNKKNCIIVPNVIDKNAQPYKQIYNNASLNFSPISKNNNEKTDEEINLEVDRRIYEINHLEDDGIEFNSPQFKSWLQKNKESLVIPVDAPAKVRKEVMDMFDSIPDDDVSTKFSIAIQINNMFGQNSIKDSRDVLNRCNDIISENSDYIEVIKMCGSNLEEDVQAINSSNKVIDFFKRFENFIKLNYR